MTIAVLGARAVGKSTFVQCSLDLKKTPISPVSSKKVSLEGKISIVRLIELSFEDLEIAADQNVRWPAKIGDHKTPIIDGVLALYSVMDQNSIARVPELLSESIGRSQPLLPRETIERRKWIQCTSGMMLQY